MMRPGALSRPLGDAADLPIVTSTFVPPGEFWITAGRRAEGDPYGPPALMCHPSAVWRLEVAIEAIGIVRDGMADVLEWLGDAYPPKPAPRNRPMPTRDLAPMIDRISAMCAAGARGERWKP